MPKTLREINTNLLIAVYQNLQTAMQSISNVIEKVKDSRLKKELKAEYKEYDSLMDKCEEMAKASDIELKNNNIFQKMRMWFSVNMATMLDKSNRKIASINIVGSTMGVIDLMGVVSDSKKAKKELLDFAKYVLEYEEENIEKLKPYILVENNKPNSEVAEDAKKSGALEPQKENPSKSKSKQKDAIHMKRENNEKQHTSLDKQNDEQN